MTSAYQGTTIGEGRRDVLETPSCFIRDEIVSFLSQCADIYDSAPVEEEFRAIVYLSHQGWASLAHRRDHERVAYSKWQVARCGNSPINMSVPFRVVYRRERWSVVVQKEPSLTNVDSYFGRSLSAIGSHDPEEFASRRRVELNFDKRPFRCNYRLSAQPSGFCVIPYRPRLLSQLVDLLAQSRRRCNWYRAGLDVERELPKLATYLGHVDAVHTYWYIQAVPELLQLAAERLGGRRD